MPHRCIAEYSLFIRTVPHYPLVNETLASFRYGPHDPTTKWDGRQFWRALRTSRGPVVLNIDVGPACSGIRIKACGTDGTLESLLADQFLGVNDVLPVVETCHPAVERAALRFGLLRLGASRDAYHELLPAVLGQRITAAEAARQWQRLCVEFGTRVCLPGAPVLYLPPDPRILATTPYWKLHTLGIERRRAETLVNVARHADYLHRLAENPLANAGDLRVIRGVGEWTAAVAGLLAFGDADALCVGDFHAKNTVAYALTGAYRGTDELMCSLLEPYCPQRARVLRWLELDGWKAPAHGPRRRNLSIARL